MRARPLLSRMAAPIILALVLAAAITAGARVMAQNNEQGVLAGFISRLLSTPTTTVTIGSIDGALSSDATINGITITDSEGVWLRLDRARIVWSRLALLSRRLQVNELEVGRLE